MDGYWSPISNHAALISFDTAAQAAKAREILANRDRRLEIFFCASLYDGINDNFDALIRLYLLAEKLQDSTTMDLAVDHSAVFSFWTGAIPLHEQVCLAYESTVHNSPLRKVLRDLSITHASDEAIDQLQDTNYPFEFLQDISIKLLKARGKMEKGWDGQWDDQGFLKPSDGIYHTFYAT